MTVELVLGVGLLTLSASMAVWLSIKRGGRTLWLFTILLAIPGVVLLVLEFMSPGDGRLAVLIALLAASALGAALSIWLRVRRGPTPSARP